MNDDFFGRDGGRGIGGTGTRTSVSRRSTTTDRLDTVFDVLGNSRRRYLLYQLVAMDESVVELEDAAEAVSEYEADQSETDRPSREDVTIALHHDHLPRLARTRILDYDPRQGTIRLTGDDELEAWVEFARSKEQE